ncbi:MAG TPA: hypothetical protein VD794_08570 [Flavisolibacter sp.]|nr:hypothetical protein [Flavisolibacter sp.]
MNQKTTYEVTITSKLDQLPIPDLREAIWARIEGELDADMPSDDGGDTPPSSPRGGKVLPFALPGLVVIIVALFLIRTNKQNSKPNTIPTTPATQTITTAPTASPPPVDSKTVIRDEESPAVYPGTSVPISTVPNTVDSTSAPVTDVLPPVTDNTNQQGPTLVQTPPPQPLKTDSVAGKKKRGVSGITDNDYRITPVKPDSSRRN